MADKYADGESYKTGSSLKRERMETFLEWLLVPEGARKPKTKTQFAESIDVTLQTLANYERDRWFQKEYAKRSRGLFTVVRASKVVDNLFSIATDKEHKNAVSAARLLLEWAGKGEVEASADASSLSDEELLNIVRDRANDIDS